MRPLVLVLALLPAAALAEERDPARPVAMVRIGAECRNADLQRTWHAQEPVRPGKLGQQPVANQYLTVLRLEDGCDRPVMIRQGIGDGAEDQR